MFTIKFRNITNIFFTRYLCEYVSSFLLISRAKEGGEDKETERKSVGNI
jgi:hypothetical protein